MNKIVTLGSRTLRGPGIPKENGQVIYSNMILDQPSNTAQPSSAKDSSSSTVGKPSMQIANTNRRTEEKGGYISLKA
ncbi:hypothetical protein CDL15_Pgr019247 [Punica granatum]|uniref:Uncharacterized protein n=1 Tax=Punica granatum TaxID=22663 RepID=A0A218Y0U1_PUNGR|nr:hypothetical protein CDL15_Pgr019247 [Punica granatum]